MLSCEYRNCAVGSRLDDVIMLTLYLVQLEYINGEIWANVWMTECIAKINPRNGAVT